MEFDSNKPIYLQIVDAFCESILAGTLPPDGRIPSVREYGAQIGVNPNTVARSYERLTALEIIYNKRGIGFFVSPDAQARILEHEKEQLLSEELPRLVERAALLGIDSETLKKYIK